ncbi:MAG: hypothetical protein AAF138_02770 [Planctomycetota bacterium]
MAVLSAQEPCPKCRSLMKINDLESGCCDACGRIWLRDRLSRLKAREAYHIRSAPLIGVLALLGMGAIVASFVGIESVVGESARLAKGWGWVLGVSCGLLPWCGGVIYCFNATFRWRVFVHEAWSTMWARVLAPIVLLTLFLAAIVICLHAAEVVTELRAASDAQPVAGPHMK